MIRAVVARHHWSLPTGTITGTTGIVLTSWPPCSLATAFMGFCPLYLPFGIRTRKQ